MKQQGFTLIEMILTLIVGSILALSIASITHLSTRGYINTVDRQRLQTQAKFVVEKISREVRHAVPNMFKQEGNCISFFPIVSSGIYAVSGQDIEFVAGDNTLTAADLNSLSLVINPTEFVPTHNNFSLKGVTEKAVSGKTFVLASSSLVGHSVSNRHYIYHPGAGIKYCIQNGRIERSQGAGPFVPISDSGVSGRLAYQPAVVQRNGVVHLQLDFSNANGDETTQFQQDIQVMNVP